jgi:hypothetical protein
LVLCGKTIAIVIIGGLITATILTLLIFRLYSGFLKRKNIFVLSSKLKIDPVKKKHHYFLMVLF